MSRETEGETAHLPDIPRQPGASPPNIPALLASFLKHLYPTHHSRTEEQIKAARFHDWEIQRFWLTGLPGVPPKMGKLTGAPRDRKGGKTVRLRQKGTERKPRLLLKLGNASPPTALGSRPERRVWLWKTELRHTHRKYTLGPQCVFWNQIPKISKC